MSSSGAGLPREKIIKAAIVREPGAFAERVSGEPVWGCPDEESLRELRVAASLFGGRMEVVQEDDCGRLGPVVCASEAVVAIGEEARESAALYAQLTGRECCIVEEPVEAVKMRSAAVLFATWRRCTISDLEAIYDQARNGRVIGLFIGESGAQLRARALLASAMLKLSSGDRMPALPSHAIIGQGDPASASPTFSRVLGAGASSLEVAQTLAGPSAVLGVVAHGDGIDMGLANDAVLCSRLGEPTIDAGRKSPNCDWTGYCHRRGLPRQAALASGALLRPVLNARVALMLTCYMARTRDCSVHPEGALLASVLANAGVGAIVTTFELTWPSATELAYLAEPLLAGATVGETLADYYQTAPWGRRGSNRYLLFGDPRMRVTGSQREWSEANGVASASSIRAEVSGRHRVAPPGHSNQERLNVHREWIRNEAERLARTVRIEGGWLARAGEILKASGVEERRQLYRALLAALILESGQKLFTLGSEKRGSPVLLNRAGSCMGCGEPARFFALPTPFGWRWCGYCSRCPSLYADVPAGSEQIENRFDLTCDGSFRFARELPPTAALAYRILSPRRTYLNYLSDDGLANVEWEAGRSHLEAHVLSDDGYYMYSRVMDRRSQGAAETSAMNASS